MFSLNKEQQAVVYSDSNRILCLAGAGTGKTACMIARIQRLVDEGVDPKSILVLTFTNAAAFEMESRFSHDKGVKPEFKTFHAFCYSLMKRDYNVCSKLGYTSVPEIADDTISEMIAADAEIQTGIHLSKNKRNGKSALTLQEYQQLNILRKAEKRLQRRMNVITFDDLCKGVCSLFEDHDACVSGYLDKYKYIFVDEFQDTDPIQYKFVSSFENSNIFVVGDALQAIYSFRGADSSIIKYLADDSEWEKHKLHYNYRSTKPICETANMNSLHADESYRIAIDTSKNGLPVSIMPYESVGRGVVSKMCLDSILSEISKLSGQTAILVRTNSEVESVSNYLTENSVVHSLKDSPENVNLNILKSIYSDEHFIKWQVSNFNRNDYFKFIRAGYTVECPIDEFVDDFSDKPQTMKYYSILEDIRYNISNISRGDDLIYYLRSSDLIPDELDVIVSSDDREEIVKHIIEGIENLECPTSDIYVGTIHSVKGLEFDNVILAGVGGHSFPLTNEENCNLLYVGITRAKTRLIIFSETNLYGG